MDDDRVRVAVCEALGVAPAAVEPAPSPRAAAAAVVDELAGFHDAELASGEVDLSERMQALFGPDVVHRPEALVAIDSVLSNDGGAHAVARDVAHRDLSEAFAHPVAAEREQRVSAILQAERQRVSARAGTRVARARQRLLSALKLPEEAYDAPQGAA